MSVLITKQKPVDPFIKSGLISLQLDSQKAVITVNADTTEILIANDNLRRLFDLNRSMDSLIGRKLADVFPSHLNKRDKYDDDVNQLELDIEEDGNNKTPLHGALFNEDGKLKPVYGKPVRIMKCLSI